MHISPLRIIKIAASSALITIQIATKTIGVTRSDKNIACSNAFAVKLKFYLIQELNLVDMSMTNYAYEHHTAALTKQYRVSEYRNYLKPAIY
jgi:hypothetical protein